jgi:signal transduction histidine kinase
MSGGASLGIGRLTGIGYTPGRSVFLSQLPLTGATALIALGIAVFAPHLFASSLLVFGIVLVFAITAAAIIVPWSRVPPIVAMSLPILDIVAIGFMRAVGDSIRLSILLILPVIWLASSMRIVGAVIGTVLGTVAAWGLTFSGAPEIALGDVSRVFLVPLMLAFVGATMAGLSIRARAQQHMLARQGLLVEEALEQAKRNRRVLDGILNAVDFGIIGLERDGSQVLINRSSSALLGITEDSPDDALRLYGADRRTPLPAAAHPLDRARGGESFRRDLVWLGAPEREQTALSVSAQQIADEHGTRTGAVVVFQDVTPEVEALRAREELVAAVSHELRTPLTSIIGYLELALDEPDLTDGARTYTRIAADNADRMLTLISDLLVAASSAEGKLTVLRRDIDLGRIVGDAVEAILPRAREREITVTCRVAPGVEAYVDELRIRQVIDNVLSNAVKYGSRGGTVVIDETRSADEIAVTVTDDGIGISTADQEKLFDRFFRASTVRGGSVGGTGLGLSISRDIMREHGGDVRIASRLGSGTTVTIAIPTDGRTTDAADAGESAS